jgi:predicted DNA-binding transcriptional regulator AlpA
MQMGDAERIRARTVCTMTSLSLRKVQEMADQGKIPSAAKLGGVWTFDPIRVRAWIRERERACLEKAGAKPSTCTGAAILGGDASVSTDESIELAYEQLIHGKRRVVQRGGDRSLSASR